MVLLLGGIVTVNDFVQDIYVKQGENACDVGAWNQVTNAFGLDTYSSLFDGRWVSIFYGRRVFL